MKIAIIGAGPAGLYFASLCQQNNIKYTIFESTNHAGGQLISLYPQKEITNIPGIPSVTSKNYISYLLTKVNADEIIYNYKVNSIKDVSTYDYIINATGVGDYSLRKLEIENADKYNVLYSLDDFSFLINKNVVIFGGGNSALDWAKQLSEFSHVTLVHRRDEFRGNPDTIKGCNLNIFLSAVPDSMDADFITIRSVKPEITEKVRIKYDYILVNFGLQFYKTEFEQADNLYSIGDCCSETRTIANCINQAEETFKKIMEKENGNI